MATWTVTELLAIGVPLHCLPTSDPEAVIEALDVSGTEFDYWFREVGGAEGETRGTMLRSNQRLVARCDDGDGYSAEMWSC